MVNQIPTAKPDAPVMGAPKHHDPRETILFVAAQELVSKGKLEADTVELLVLLAPQPTVVFAPPPAPGLMGNLSVIFVGAGSAFSKDEPIDSERDAAQQGKLQVMAEDKITNDIAAAAKATLKRLIHQRNAAVAAHMKKKREKMN